MSQPICANTLFFGDNFTVLREHIPSASIDLIYLDPPFNSSRTYNLIYKDAHGKASEAQAQAFEDSWFWNDSAEQTYHDVVMFGDPRVSSLLSAMRQMLGPSPLLAYLVMMTARLIEMHRVLKPTGSLYLHCDPTASHYLKLVLDGIFGPERFINEIIWKRSHAHNSGTMFGPIHDVLLFYSKSASYTWIPQHRPFDESYIDSHYSNIENGRRYKRQDMTGAGTRNGETGQPWRGIDPTPKGRHWMRPPSDLDKLDAEGRVYWPNKPGAWPYLKLFLDERPGMLIQDLWDDIDPVNPVAKERLGYPTQKPLSLLERIINTSSNPGDVVLDPFCGCGTAIDAAQRLGRRWIGIDITHLAIQVIQGRLKATYPGITYEVRGEPKDLAGAEQLARENRYQFQWWAAWLVRARSLGGETGSKRGKKGADRGIDGLIPFQDELNGPVRQAVVQIKSGTLKPDDIRALLGVIEREQSPIGVLVTLQEPTRAMRADAAAAGIYHSPGWKRDYPRLQILTIAELLAGSVVKMPPPSLLKAAPKAATGDQQSLDLLDAAL